jgi:hypothetical protein
VILALLPEDEMQKVADVTQVEVNRANDNAERENSPTGESHAGSPQADATMPNIEGPEYQLHT